MTRKILVLLALGWLTGCATTQPPVSVSVPVSVPCVRAEDVPPRPTLHAEAAWANLPPDVFERAKALLADRLLLLAHAQRLEAILQACAGEPTK